MKKIIHKFTETGEVRPPRKNEGYSIDNTIYIQDSDGTTVTSYPILTYERIIEEWKPKYQDNYFYLTGIDIELKVWNDMWTNSDADDKRYSIGNCFPTKELAEKKLKQIKDILKGVTQ